MGDDSPDVAEDAPDGAVDDEGRRQVHVLAGVTAAAETFDVRSVAVFSVGGGDANVRSGITLFRLGLSVSVKMRV